MIVTKTDVTTAAVKADTTAVLLAHYRGKIKNVRALFHCAQAARHLAEYHLTCDRVLDLQSPLFASPDFHRAYAHLEAAAHCLGIDCEKPLAPSPDWIDKRQREIGLGLASGKSQRWPFGNGED